MDLPDNYIIVERKGHRMKKKMIVVIGLIASLMRNTFYADATNDGIGNDTSFRENELPGEMLPDENNLPTENISDHDLNTDEAENSDLMPNDELLPLSENAEATKLPVTVDHTAETTIQISWENLGEGHTYVISLNGAVVGECTENTYQITDLTGGTAYEVSVEALNEAGRTVAASESIVVYTDWTVSSNLTLYENKTVGNLSVNNGTLNLNGHTLTVKRLSMSSNIDLSGGTLNVKENVTQMGGVMNIGGGKLLVEGNYEIENPSSRNKESYGYLKMADVEGCVLVGGNFTTRAYYSHNGYLTAGTLEVKGDFTQGRQTVRTIFTRRKATR